MTDHVVDIADRATTVDRFVEALSALKSGRNSGQETVGIPAPMRRAAAEGLADLGFRFVEAVATQRIVMPETTWLGPHANGTTAAIDPALAKAVLADVNPDLAARVTAATTNEQREAECEALRPDVEATLQTGLALDEATSAMRMQGKYEAAVEREKRAAKERGE